MGNQELSKQFQLHFINLRERLQEAANLGREVFPSPQQQGNIIHHASNVLCAWRVIIDMKKYKVLKVFEGDQYFPFSQPVGIEMLVSCIHPSYLVPFLLCAEFAYTYTSELGVEPSEIPDYAFQLSVPFKFPGDEDFCWYNKVSNTISINEHRCILTHTNIYYYEKKFNPFEYRLMQPAVLKKGKLFRSLHEGLLNKLRQHISISLTAHEKKVIMLYTKGYKLKAVAGEMGTTEGTERARNNTILKKVKEILGFKFTTIVDLADFFHQNQILQV